MRNKKHICKDLLKDYCSNCSFAGVRFIADDTKHWIERLVWLALVILSWYGSALLIISAWDAFVTSPISFGVETTYSDWSTKMPTVAVCEIANDPKLYNVSDAVWTKNHLPDLEDVLREITYFRGIAYSLVDICYLNSEPDPNCPKSNFSYYVNLVRSDCTQVMRNCSYNNEQFDCCEYFQPIATDIGTCFIINSIQTENPKPYPMINNLNNNLGILAFEVILSSMVYTLGEEEFPTITTTFSSTLKVQLGNNYRRMVSVRNIENDPRIKETTPEQRVCRFHHENEEGLYPYYSYSACTVLCRKKGQMERCKCNDHFMLGATEDQVCNLSGLACLHSFSNHLTILKPPWGDRPGLTCNCLPSCDETDITIIKDITTQSRLKGYKKRAKVEIELSYLPTERFKRNVVRSRLDLVVSIGSTTGLFVGASLLSFVELIFFLTVRFIDDVWMKKQRNRNCSLNNTRSDKKLQRFANPTLNKDKIKQRPYVDAGLKVSKKFYNHIFQRVYK